MGEQAWASTETAVRAALDTGNLRELVTLLVPTVTWHGSGPGGCHTREDVAAWLAGLPAGFRLRWLRREADRIGISITTPAGGDAHELLILDDAGQITAILDHPDAHSVESDLAAPTEAPNTAAALSAVADGLVPFVHVTDIEASIVFYSRLGFEIVADHHSEHHSEPDSDHDCGPQRVWASLRCGPSGGRHAALMLAATDHRVAPAVQGALFYLYTDDLTALREQLRRQGQMPSAITDGTPGPRRELRIDDPDGYCLMIAERE